MSKNLYRHEQKYYIKDFQYDELKYRLSQLMYKDENALEEDYAIRSLYFDDFYQTAYKEKEDGLSIRKKYRIRIYNYSDKTIKLECKHKRDAYIFKEGLKLTPQEYQMILSGDTRFLLQKNNQLANEFYIDMKTKLLKPRVIVDYEREPYVDPAGTVRITFDKNVRAAPISSDLFDRDATTYETLKPDMMILEVKFTGLLPEKIRKLFNVRNYTQTSASKFCMAVDEINKIRI